MSSRLTLSVLGVASIWVLASSAAWSQACTPAWQPTFSGPTGVDNAVHSLGVFDDGSGPALYAGGYLLSAGGQPVNRLAKWDGSAWSAVGAGRGENVFDVRALLPFDDGSGPALYVAGDFPGFDGVSAKYIARWNGSSWSSVGGGVTTPAYALTVFDDGNGPALYAAGSFKFAGGVAVNSVAKWDGSVWSALGLGMGGPTKPSVNALAVFDDGTGLALYAGGDFTIAGGVTAHRVAKWNGHNWSPLGSGVEQGSVNALAVFDDGSGPALYVGGSFGTAGGVAASRIARWNGSSWSALGQGVSNAVVSMLVHDDGGGSALFVGGSFSSAGGAPAGRVAKWDGSSWSPLGGGLSGIGGAAWDLKVFDDGTGDGAALFVGGSFTLVPDSGDSYLGQWVCHAEPSRWEDLGLGLAGVAGVPSLVGTGTLEAGSPGALTLASANPASITNLFVSFASVPAPFKGGTLVPVPPALMLTLFTTGMGSIPLAWAAWPAGVPVGTSLFFQYAIADPAAPAGVALSNALHAITP